MPVVAAAASVRYALDEIAATFEKESGSSVRLSYGATGNLVRQIEHGGPYEVFLAADEESIGRLEAAGLTDGPGVAYAQGRISLVAPKGSPVTVDSDMKGLVGALEANKVTRFAVANPELAPYGRAAREALQHVAGLWQKIEPKLVFGENVGQAAQFASSGGAEAGIIAQSLAQSKEISPLITAAQIREDWHKPIRQRMALLKGAGETARAFFAYLRGPEARAVFEKNGFTVP